MRIFLCNVFVRSSRKLCHNSSLSSFQYDWNGIKFPTLTRKWCSCNAVNCINLDKFFLVWCWIIVHTVLWIHSRSLFAGQLLVGPFFTNFMLITILGFLALKLFLSSLSYETKLVPTRWQSIYEMMYGFILQTVCEAIGSKRGEKFFPAYLTLFFFVLSANVIALFPYTYSITAQLIVTFTISFFAFTVINMIGFLHHGGIYLVCYYRRDVR